MTLATLASASCASYEPSPLVPARELADLLATRLDAVRIDYAAAGPASERGASRFDPVDGLDEAELAALALTLNPALRARRMEIGEAQALLVSAGLLPNPDIATFVRPGLDGASGTGFGLDILFELLRPDERPAKRAIAVANVEIVRAEIAVEESRVVSDVRRARIRVLSAEEAGRLLEQELALRAEVVELVRRQRDLGETTELSLAVVELDRTNLERQVQTARGAVEAERAALNAALGLPPTIEVQLVGSGTGLTFVIQPDATDEDLDARLVARGPRLLARAAAYERAESELRLAISRQFPRIAIGPSYEKDVEGSEGLGLAATVELPLFDRGQGPIAEKTALRDRARAEYAATLFDLRAQAFAARAQQRRARDEVETQRSVVIPLVERTEALFEGALRAREVSIFEWLAARARAIQARRDLLESLTRYANATVELDSATGTPLVTVLVEEPGASSSRRVR